MRRPSPTVIAIIAGVLVLLLLVYVFLGNRGDANSDKLSDDQVAGGIANDPEKTCGSQRTYDLIKRELFRRAAQLRGSDQAAFDRLAAYSVVRMDAPMLRTHEKDFGRVTCAGTLALDLPPGVAVVGGRRTLTANIGYAVQGSADGNGDVLTLTSAEGIIAPLATLARVGSATGDPLAPGTPSDPADVAVPPTTNDPLVNPPPPTPAPPRQVTPDPAPPRATASPSFNCRNARTRGEIAVCGDAGLAGLDRQMASQFNGALSQADANQRALLQRTRSRFLTYRDSCRSDSCIADTYRGRIREIDDIMAGRWRGR